MNRRIPAILGRLMQTFRLHKWLLLTCLIATSTYALVSPERVYPPPNSSRDLVYWQGWPMVYVIRVSDLGWEAKRWDRSIGPWCIFHGIKIFYLGPLLVDIAVALGLSLVAVCLWRLHCSVNEKPWQFSIREAMVVSLTVAIVLGPSLATIKGLRNRHDKEMAFLAELEKTGWETRASVDPLPWYLRPLMQAGAIREQDYAYRELEWPGNVNRIHSPEQLEQETEDINVILAKLASDKAPFSLIHSLVIADRRLDERGIEALCKLFPDCADLDLSGFLNGGLPHVGDEQVAYLTSHLRDLNSLTLLGAPLTDKSVRHLEKMHKLTNLAFDDRGETTTNSGLNCLLTLPNIHSLGVPAHWAITNEEREVIARRGLSVNFIDPG